MSTPPTIALSRHTARERICLTIHGAVQGVGFRPFVFRLAAEIGITGWVLNTGQGVIIEAEGEPEQLAAFRERLRRERPPAASIHSLESRTLAAAGYESFEIRASLPGGEKSTLVLPDIATCPDCLREVFDPANRRFRYPFTNCTNCGPRFTIITSLPYDRVNTTMRGFVMCSVCRAEYEDPHDRRFHAQPNACPVCGPRLQLLDGRATNISEGDNALLEAIESIRAGLIVAVKGLGGFHLMVDARNNEAVRRLRQRKAREEKPFALMYPSLASVQEDCQSSPVEKELLLSCASPIVLLRRNKRDGMADGVARLVAPGNPYLGVMLPYTPLHHLLMQELGSPVVATSGNRSDEPICTDADEAQDRLRDIADFFLVHDRPIVRPVDDSVCRVLAGRELVLRRARGYAPLPVRTHHALRPILAVGSHLKNTVAAAVGSNIFVSQHLGDLETALARRTFESAIASMRSLYDFHPEVIACDQHPDYLSTQYARRQGLPVRSVQHHHAHILSCMGENDLRGPALGVAWDGTGLGPDGTIWGGEFLHVDGARFDRIAHLRQFPLPGGDRAIVEPRRAAIGLLYSIIGDELWSVKDLLPLNAFTLSEQRILRRALERRINTPLTSSAGRLFDAVAAIIGVRQRTRFEGQAAMELEYLADGADSDSQYPFALVRSQEPWIVNTEPMIRAILEDRRLAVSSVTTARKFHNTLAQMILAVATAANERNVVLSGGCFQNAYLTERVIAMLHASGFQPYWHQRVPPNDGGIALGQVLAAMAGCPTE